MKRFAFKRLALAAPLAGAAILVLGACTATPAPTQQPPTASPAGSSGPGAPAPGALTGGSGALNLDALRAAVAAAPSLNGGQQQTGIWVQGLGSVMAKPDIGTLFFGVETRAGTVAEARSQAAAAMDAALQALRKRGVEDKDVQTQFFNIQPVIVYRETGTRGTPPTPEIVGYMVSNSARVKVRKIDDLGNVIDDVAKAGGDAIRINQVGFTIDDPKPLESKARELAVKDGVTKAQEMGKAAGVKVGPPIFISESGGSPVVAKQEARFAPSAGADVSTPISPGESQITISVQMVFPLL